MENFNDSFRPNQDSTYYQGRIDYADDFLDSNLNNLKDEDIVEIDEFVELMKKFLEKMLKKESEVWEEYIFQYDEDDDGETDDDFSIGTLVNPERLAVEDALLIDLFQIIEEAKTLGIKLPEKRIPINYYIEKSKERLLEENWV
jgi:hypothetical protein